MRVVCVRVRMRVRRGCRRGRARASTRSPSAHNGRRGDLARGTLGRRPLWRTRAVPHGRNGWRVRVVAHGRDRRRLRAHGRDRWRSGPVRGRRRGRRVGGGPARLVLPAFLLEGTLLRLCALPCELLLLLALVLFLLAALFLLALVLPLQLLAFLLQTRIFARLFLPQFLLLAPLGGLLLLHLATKLFLVRQLLTGTRSGGLGARRREDALRRWWGAVAALIPLRSGRLRLRRTASKLRGTTRWVLRRAESREERLRCAHVGTRDIRHVNGLEIRDDVARSVAVGRAGTRAAEGVVGGDFGVLHLFVAHRLRLLLHLLGVLHADLRLELAAVGLLLVLGRASDATSRRSAPGIRRRLRMRLVVIPLLRRSAIPRRNRKRRYRPTVVTGGVLPLRRSAAGLRKRAVRRGATSAKRIEAGRCEGRLGRCGIKERLRHANGRAGDVRM
eukprot:Opistho-1_new@16510